MISYVGFSLLLFTIGSCGVYLSRRNLIMLIMSFEVMLLSVNMIFVFGSVHLDDIVAHVYVLCILAIAGVESAIGLAMIISYYKKHKFV